MLDAKVPAVVGSVWKVLLIMNVGETWAYRDKPRTPGTPVRPVEVLQHGPPRSQRVRVRWIDGEYDGLDEWVSATRLVCLWDNVDLFQRDERNLTELRTSVAEYDELLVDAADFVLDTVLELSRNTAVMGYNRNSYGTFIVSDTDALPHMTISELMGAPRAFISREGVYWGPWTVGVEVARRVCADDPDAVLAAVSAAEQADRKAAIRGRQDVPWSASWPPTPQDEQQLRGHQLVSDQIRQWCGTSRTEEWDRVAELSAEVDRLHRLAEEMIDWLKLEDHPVKAGMFRRRLDDR